MNHSGHAPESGTPGAFVPAGLSATPQQTSSLAPVPAQGHSSFGDRGQPPVSGTASPPLTSLQVQVNPPGLGPVDVRVQVQGSQVTTALQVVHGGAQTALWNHQDGLRQALGQHGLQLAGLQVGVQGHGGQGAGGGQQWTGGTPRPAAGDPGTAPRYVGRAPVPSLASTGRLDLVG